MKDETRRLVISLLVRERENLAFIRNPSPAHEDQKKRVEDAIREIEREGVKVSV